MDARMVARLNPVLSGPVTVTELCRALGPGWLSLVDPGGRSTDAIAGVWVYEPGASAPATDQLALITGVDSTDATIAGMSEAVARGCVGVVVDGPLPPTVVAALRRVARAQRVALYERCAEVSWLALADAVRDVVRERGRAGEDLVGSVAPGDLPALAEALADLLGGPVIIEDANFHVLAYTTWTGAVDHGRDSAILGGRIPTEWLEHLEKVGAVETLLTSDEVVDVEHGPFQAHRRLLRAIRVDDQLLGVLWVAEGNKPLPADVAPTMDVAARIAAPHLLRRRDEMFGQRAAQRKILRALVETGEVSRSVAEDMGLVPAHGYVMLALRRTPDAALDHAERNRLVESVDLYCQSYRWRAATTAVGHTVYCLVGLDEDGAHTGVGALATGLADNSRRTLRFDVVVAVSEDRPRLASAPELRAQADGVLDVLDRVGSERVLRYRDAVPQILLDRFGELVREHEQSGYHKLDRLRSHDEAHSTDYVHTLAVYLRSFGNVKRAADELDLHPTTLRYRLRRIAELSGLDLENSDERLFCELVLRDSQP